MTYFANKYSPDNPIYPPNPKKRSIVDRLLQFDLNVLYRSLRDFLIPIVCEGKKINNLNPQKEHKVIEALSYLESILKANPFVAGGHLTLADFSFYFSLEFAEEFQYDFCKYENICLWFQRMQAEISEINQRSHCVTISAQTQLKANEMELQKQNYGKIEINIHHQPNPRKDLLNLVKVTTKKKYKSSSMPNNMLTDTILNFDQSSDGEEVSVFLN